MAVAESGVPMRGLPLPDAPEEGSLVIIMCRCDGAKPWISWNYTDRLAFDARSGTFFFMEVNLLTHWLETCSNGAVAESRLMMVNCLAVFKTDINLCEGM